MPKTTTQTSVSVTIPWTAGYDSTALLLLALQSKSVHEIHLPYFEWENNPGQMKAEAAAREVIMGILKDHPGFAKIKGAPYLVARFDVRHFGDGRQHPSEQGAFMAPALAVARIETDELWLGYTYSEGDHSRAFRRVWCALTDPFYVEDGRTYQWHDGALEPKEPRPHPALRFPLTSWESKNHFLFLYEDDRWFRVFEALSTDEHGINWRREYIAGRVKDQAAAHDSKSERLARLYIELCRRRNVSPIWEPAKTLATKMPEDVEELPKAEALPLVAPTDAAKFAHPAVEVEAAAKEIEARTAKPA